MSAADKLGVGARSRQEPGAGTERDELGAHARTQTMAWQGAFYPGTEGRGHRPGACLPHTLDFSTFQRGVFPWNRVLYAERGRPQPFTSWVSGSERAAPGPCMP